MYSCELLFMGWSDLSGNTIPFDDTRIFGYNVSDFFKSPMPDNFTSDDAAEEWWSENFRGHDVFGIWPTYELASD